MYSSILVNSHPRSYDVAVERISDLLKYRFAGRRVRIKELTYVEVTLFWS